MCEGMKKVVVTGASGYLGGKLCDALLRQGYSVKALVRPTSDLSALPSSSEIVYGDITDYTSLLSAFSDCSVVFHLAALVAAWHPDPSKIFSVNVEGLKNVLEAVKKTNTVKKLIFTSSIFAFGPTYGSIADENQVHHEKYFCTEYEKSKVASEKIALQAACEGVPIVLLYPGFIYGPGKVTSGNAITELLIERFNGRLPGYIGKGKNKLSLCHVDDVVEGHIAAMIKGKIGERYLLTGQNVSINQIFDMAAVNTNTRKPMFIIPFWMLRVYGWFSVLFFRITGKLPLITPPAVDMLRHAWEYSCEKAKMELDYNPRSMNEGIAEVLPWLKNLGLVKY